MVANFKKKQKKPLLKDILFRTGGIVLLVLAIKMAISSVNLYHDKRDVDMQISAMMGTIQNLQDRNKELQGGIMMADDGVYLEKIAREELDLKKPGEKVVSFIMPEDTEYNENNAKEQRGSLSRWLVLIGSWFKK